MARTTARSTATTRGARATGARIAAAAIAAIALGACSHAIGSGDTAPSTTAAPTTGCGRKTRTYYIAADRVAWDYAPRGHNLITGKPWGDVEKTYVQSGPDRIGKVYEKSLYRAYTDASFTKLAPRPADQASMGFLGPLIQAEVGDTIVVHFKNNTPFPASMHPHGVFYAKDSEGAPYDDGTSGADKADDTVPRGGTHTYVWQVPERAGPGPRDESSVMWMYHSHVDEIADTNSGLVGPIVVTRCGMARADGSPEDVDRQEFALFTVENENQSHWLHENIQRYTGDPSSVDVDDDDFNESNLMHSINGYVYGNGPMFTMKQGERVRWYVMSMGTEVDLHTPHWHGNTVTVMGMRTDVVQLLPAAMVVADMVPDDPGIWLFHCHVNDHIRAGMLARYQVLPS